MGQVTGQRNLLSLPLHAAVPRRGDAGRLRPLCSPKQARPSLALESTEQQKVFPALCFVVTAQTASLPAVSQEVLWEPGCISHFGNNSACSALDCAVRVVPHLQAWQRLGVVPSPGRTGASWFEICDKPLEKLWVPTAPALPTLRSPVAQQQKGDSRFVPWWEAMQAVPSPRISGHLSPMLRACLLWASSLQRRPEQGSARTFSLAQHGCKSCCFSATNVEGQKVKGSIAYAIKSQIHGFLLVQ